MDFSEQKGGTGRGGKAFIFSAFLRKVFAFAVVCNWLNPACVMAAVETNSAGGGSGNPSNGGTVSWTGPGNIVEADGSSADATSSSKTDVTTYLQATSFGFSIPAGSVVRGITVNVLRSASSDGTAKNFTDTEVRLVKGGVVSSADNKADAATAWPATAATAAYGATNDLWQESWEAADINSAGFGVVVAASRSGTGGGGLSAYVDHVQVAVAYDPPQVQYSLTVNSAHGNPSPSGVTALDANSLVDAFMPGSPIDNGTTQYVCTGWVGTGSVTSGSGTNVSFTITSDTTITWQWQTNYWMNIETAGI